MASRTARCIALLLCVAAVPSGAAAQDTSRNVLETKADGVKSVISKESVPLLSTAAAWSLVALPFDETLTYSGSCSIFLKTSFDGWARVAGQEWVLGSGALATDLIGGAAVGVLAGRAATFDLGGRRVSLSPAVTAGGMALSGSIRQ